MSKSFDISSLAASDTSTFQLTDAAGNLIFAPAGEDGGEPKPVTVTVYGPGSKEHARADNKRTNRNIQRLRKKGDVKLSEDEAAAEHAEFLASITVGFENMEYKGLSGREMFVALYADRPLGFIADQISEHVRSWENFTAGSEKN